MRRVRYQRVIWQHDHEEEPAVLWSEIGRDGFERRKANQYRDGRLDFADENTSTGTTLLGGQPIPTLKELNAEKEFTAAPVSLPSSRRSGNARREPDSFCQMRLSAPTSSGVIAS